MNNADSLTGSSDKALVAELRSRIEQSPDFLEQALATLTKNEVRPDVEHALASEDESAPATAESAETENLNPELVVYYREYTSLPDNIKARTSWEAITERLLENDSEKLKLAKAMQGEGQLFGIDSEGNALFKDRGTEPVMYGFNEKGKLLKIYNRDPERMKQVQKWADYNTIREQVLEEGCELFSYYGDRFFGDEIQQVRDHTQKLFIVSEDRKEWRVSWLESGDSPDGARYIQFNPINGSVDVFKDHPLYWNGNYGAVRLLRV